MEILIIRNPIGWFEIYVQVMHHAKRFDETVLRVELIKLVSPAAALEIEMLAFPMNITD